MQSPMTCQRSNSFAGPCASITTSSPSSVMIDLQSPIRRKSSSDANTRSDWNRRKNALYRRSRTVPLKAPVSLDDASTGNDSCRSWEQRKAGLKQSLQSSPRKRVRRISRSSSRPSRWESESPVKKEQPAKQEACKDATCRWQSSSPRSHSMSPQCRRPIREANAAVTDSPRMPRRRNSNNFDNVNNNISRRKMPAAFQQRKRQPALDVQGSTRDCGAGLANLKAKVKSGFP
ncbi:expressed unknown protein [Seminavis robusta]|uniref:Uncharacterized protein n=1 Tax=Seminavis robusta TaxID=568900 RepID=A0A9N8I0L2_9STRA|nr:expressed unknown protein [Seminavis robusta]|eukprot:Sro2756_g336320.1 n/a (232) ;mRNA; f:8652-9347